jgi:predicted transposase YdaD
VLLRPAADGPELTGIYEESFPGLGQNPWFRYNVVRVWLQPPERSLTAGLPLLPLAPVSDVPPERLPEVLAAVAERLRDEAGPELKTTLWTATVLLMGLYYPKEYVHEVTKEMTTIVLGIRGIEESSVYQDIFAKGRAEGEAKGRAEGEAKGRAEGEAKGRAEAGVAEDRRVLLSLGRVKFGPSDERVEAQIAAIADQARLHRLLEGILHASTWDELLASVES